MWPCDLLTIDDNDCIRMLLWTDPVHDVKEVMRTYSEFPILTRRDPMHPCACPKSLENSSCVTWLGMLVTCSEAPDILQMFWA